jgi:hypothetical protein
LLSHFNGRAWTEGFQNRVLRKIFEPQRDEATGERIKLHSEELHILYSSPKIIR